MKNIENEYYLLDSCFEISKRNDKHLYLDLINSNWFRTNTTGAEILNEFDGTKTVSAILRKISDKESFPYEAIKSRFVPFIERAIDRKLLLKKDEEREVLDSPFNEYPVDLWIHLTDLCNMRCPFCYSSSGNSGNQTLDMNRILAFVSKIPYNKRKNIIISGGEPFLYTDLPQLMIELKELGFHITIISNGTVGNDIYSQVLPYINTLQISIDGSKESVYEFTRGKGNFDKAVKSLNLAHKLGMRNIVTSFTTNSSNIFDIENLPEFAMKNHVNHIHITRIIPSGRANDIMDKIVPSSDEFADAIKRLANSVLKINRYIETLRETEEYMLDENHKTKYVTFSVSSDPVRKLTNQTKITTCSIANGTVSINYDGNIYSCGCLHIEKTKLGTIDDDIEKIMKNGIEMCEKFDVNNPVMKECFNCRIKYICGGGCRACANAVGDIQGADPICNYYKDRIDEVMWESPAYQF